MAMMDGKQDLAIASDVGSNGTLTMLLGDGGVFTSQVVCAAGFPRPSPSPARCLQILVGSRIQGQFV